MRRWIALALVWLCLPLGALGEAAPQANGRVNRALLVGCDEFLSQMDTTPSSSNNVQQMAHTLSGGNMQLAEMVTRPDGVASTGQLAALILDTFADADADDVSYFYISTHGVWDESTLSGGMTLVLSDGKTESGVTALQLRTMFDQIPGTKVLLVDVCHAGAMIGKGVDGHMRNVFSGPDYVVVCSSGGTEESWFWAGDVDGEALAGEGYFSGALVRGLSVGGGYGADDNRDGVITLTELRRYLLDNHGASTVRTYPEESSFAVLTYDAGSYNGRSRDARITGVNFESDVLRPDEPDIAFTFNVVSSVQVAYQLVYHRQGRWDFDGAELIYDNDGQFSPWPIAGRTLAPGMKSRAITLHHQAGSSGYVLLQVLIIDRGVPSVACSRVLCVPPEGGDPLLQVDAPAFFCPEDYEELTFNVHHAVPCELTVTIVDMQGNTVRRLASRQATRPEQLSPAASGFTWNGLCSDGSPAPEGTYYVKVRAYVGNERYEYLSEPILLLTPLG